MHCGSEIHLALHKLEAESPRFCSPSCRAKYNWRQGKIGIGPAPNWKGPAKQRWGGRWGGPKGARFGHLGAVAGIEASRLNLGRPPKLTPEEQARILTLNGDGLSSREISLELWGTTRFKNRVLRFLSR